MKNKALIVLTSVVVILSVMACSFGDILGKATETPVVVINTPVVNTPVVPPPAGDIEILSTSAFTDTYGAFNVFGEVKNNLDTPITSVELSISITDSSGASLLKDDNGNPTDSLTFYSMLWTLDSGESSPFTYYFDTTNGIPANYEVTVFDYTSGTANRGELESENVQIIDDGSGYFVLTGELVNMSSQWVHIYGLTGGVMDDANTILSADWTGTYASVLAPTGDADGRDRTPFYVNFPVPTLEVTQWSLWWDADITSDVTDYAMTVEVTNTYFDQFGSVHLVGLVTNNTDEALNSLVVAGLYTADGTVLDASYSFMSLPVLPGKSVPFDISYFGSVNWNEDQAALVDSYTVQIDPWSTYPPFGDNVPLTPVGESIEKNNAAWTVTGNLSNTTAQNLGGITVLVAVYDSSDNLVGMGYTYTYSDGDFYAPGDTDSYEINIYLDPDADTSGFTTRTFVVADVSE